MIDISVIWFIKLAHFWKYHENNVVGLSFHLQVDSKSTISIDTIQFSFPLTLTFWYHLSLYPLNHTKDLFSYLLQFSLQIKDERVSKPVCNTCYLTHFFFSYFVLRLAIKKVFQHVSVISHCFIESLLSFVLIRDIFYCQWIPCHTISLHIC